MNTSDVVSILLRGAMGGRGRKRARRALKFLTGNRGFLTASTLLGAAGVAWGVYDSLKTDAPAAAGAGATGMAGSVPPVPGGTGTAADAAGRRTAAGPLLSTSALEGAVLPDDVLRVVRLAISAARADGTLSSAERALILDHARQAGIEGAVENELNATRPLSQIVAGISDEERRQDLYALAFTIVRADEHVSGAERIYLAQLAHQLALDTATVARLEQDIATRIDSTTDHDGRETPDSHVAPE